MPSPRVSLTPCPTSPNCVSSEADAHDQEHYIAPLAIPLSLSPEAALDAFEALLRAGPRTQVHERQPRYLRASARTPLFQFVDDIEARVDPQTRLLHVRSASRLGYSDLGTNRRRVSGWLRSLAERWRVRWP